MIKQFSYLTTSPVALLTFLSRGGSARRLADTAHTPPAPDMRAYAPVLWLWACLLRMWGGVAGRPGRMSGQGRRATRMATASDNRGHRRFRASISRRRNHHLALRCQIFRTLLPAHLSVRALLEHEARLSIFGRLRIYAMTVRKTGRFRDVLASRHTRLPDLGARLPRRFDTPAGVWHVQAVPD